MGVERSLIRHLSFIIRHSAAACILVLLATLLIPSLKLLADASPSTPSTQPDLTQYRQWITQLADADPEVRATASQNLMGLTRNDLPELRQDVLSLQPLLPVQADALHDIVRQVYLSSEPYPPLPREGFLGVSYEATRIGDTPGLLVAQRIPGFEGFRILPQW